MRLAHEREANRLMEAARMGAIQDMEEDNAATAIAHHTVGPTLEEAERKAFNGSFLSISLETLVAMTSAQTPALDFEADDGKALEEMVAAASREPYDINKVEFLSFNVTEIMALCEASAPLAPVSSTEPPEREEDQKALEGASSGGIPSPNQSRTEEPKPFGLSNCSICSSHLHGVETTEEHDETEALWAQMEVLENQGATLEEQARAFVALSMPRAKVSGHEENEPMLFPTHGAFIDSAFDDDQQKRFDDFWQALDEDLCCGAEMMPQVQKLLDCFVVKVPAETSGQHFFIGDDVHHW